MNQLQAGYLLDGVRTALYNDRVLKILHQLSHFELHSNTGLLDYPAEIDPILAVAHNILVRGLPTRPSLYIETTFETTFDLLYREVTEDGHLRFGLHNAVGYADRLEGALHIVDPRLATHHEGDTSLGYATDNLENPLYQSELGMTCLELTLSPLLIARIQKAMLQLIVNGKLSLNADVWKIVVLERDVPGSYLAIKDFEQLMKCLFILEGKGRKLPEISLTVYHTPAFRPAKLNQLFREQVKDLSVAAEDTKAYDVLLDVSVLRKKQWTEEDQPKNCSYKLQLFSAANMRSTRRFWMGDSIAYQLSAAQLNGNRDRVENALVYLLRNLFRKQNFRKGQLTLIKNGLLLHNTFGLLPPNHGKSLVYQMLALLQAGMTFIAQPLPALMKDQCDGMFENGIDCFLMINSLLRTANAKQKAYQSLQNGEFLLVVADPEILQKYSFRKELDKLFKKGIYWSYGIVDEAHCLSEWGHDFRTTYISVGENLTTYCKTRNLPRIPVMGLTSSATYNTLSDIVQALNVNEEHITTLYAYQFPHLKAQVIPLKTNLTGNSYALHNVASIKSIKKPVGELKQKEITQQLHQIYRLPVQESTLIFCPEKYWKFGILGIKGLTPLLRNTFDDLPIGTFMGYDEEENDQSIKESEQNLDWLRDQKLSVLVSTQDLGIGINLPNINHLFFFNMPNSLESFLQSATRIGRGGNPGVCTILYNNHPIRYQEEIPETTANGALKITSIDRVTTIDKQVLRDAYKQRFRGHHPEWQIVRELLREIRYPLNRPAQYIADLVEEEFGVHISITSFQNNSISRLYVNQGLGQSYGFIDLKTNTVNTDYANFERTFGHSLLTFIKRRILESCPPEKNIADWLTSSTQRHPQIGILPLLDTMEIGERKRISINYENDLPERITNYLQETIDERITEKIVHKVFKTSCCEPFAILERLRQALAEELNLSTQLNEQIAQELIPLFQGMRTKKETIKGIHRLMLAGVVENFAIQNSNRTITLNIQKKKPETYLNTLKNYFSRFIPPKEVQDRLTQIKEGIYPSLIENCMNTWLEFIYQHLAQSRYEAIDIMEKACERALQEDNEQYNLLNYADLWLHARYACPDYSPNLLADTQHLQSFSFDLVDKYIDEIGDKRDKWLHLANACARLRQQTDHYSLQILQGYAMSLLYYKHPKKRVEAENCLLDGFLSWRDAEGISDDKVNQRHQAMLGLMGQQNEVIQEVAHPDSLTLLLNKHSHWLKAFNDKFLVDYEK